MVNKSNKVIPTPDDAKQFNDFKYFRSTIRLGLALLYDFVTRDREDHSLGFDIGAN